MERKIDYQSSEELDLAVVDFRFIFGLSLPMIFFSLANLRWDCLS